MTLRSACMRSMRQSARQVEGQTLARLGTEKRATMVLLQSRKDVSCALFLGRVLGSCDRNRRFGLFRERMHSPSHLGRNEHAFLLSIVPLPSGSPRA